MLKDFLTKTGITKLIDSVRLAGLTVADHLKVNRNNTKTTLKNLFKRSVMGEVAPDVFSEQLSKTVKTRKRQTLTTLKNVMSGVRGRGRAVLSVGRKGTWYNNGTLDGKTTAICSSYMGASWPTPPAKYADIPDKPPRVSVTPHPCRSFLTFVPEGKAAPNQADFMEQFNASEELKEELLDPVRYKAYAEGRLTINSFADYEKATLNTIEELGL